LATRKRARIGGNSAIAIASVVVTRNSPLGFTSRPATRRSKSTIESAIAPASPIISSPAAVGR
jgi:hypothetical protein